MLAAAWQLIKESVNAYIDDAALGRGAAISYYTVTSFAPVLVLVITVAGLVFGEEAAQGAIYGQVRGLMGDQSAELLQTVLRNAADKSEGTLAGILGIVTLILTASGVFSEMQSALNAMWRARPQGGTVSRLVRARMAGLGLVGALGFLLLASLVISAALKAMEHYLEAWLPLADVILQLVNFAVSLGLLTLIFAAIYKVLPDRELQWKDVFIGAAVTAVLFNLGKSLIGLYLGSSSMGSAYGAAGGLLILLVWVYYSAQIFLLGAEFTKVYASHYGSFRGTDVARSVEQAQDGGTPTREKPPLPQR